MKQLLALFLIVLMAAPAFARKPLIQDFDDSMRVSCDLLSICWTWDGSFTGEMCDTGGASLWAYGPSILDPAVDCDGNAVDAVLGTVLNGDYPNDAGERAILGTIHVDETCSLLEICHYFDTENSYDGGNVEVGVAGTWAVIEPMGGYPDDELSDSVNFYAWCVDTQPGFTDGPTGYTKDCFDLVQYMGQSVEIAVKFGSDSSVTYPGWYITSVVAGSLLTPVDDSTWSTIKTLY